MRHVVYLIPLLLLACGEQDCEDRILDAERRGRLDAEACTWSPETLVEPDCSRSDIRPLLGYYANYCNTAELTCIDGDTDAVHACFGNP